MGIANPSTAAVVFREALPVLGGDPGDTSEPSAGDEAEEARPAPPLLVEGGELPCA